MSDRTINFGESETEATYQIQDTDGAAGGGNFVIAKDTNANTVLLQYNPASGLGTAVADVVTGLRIEPFVRTNDATVGYDDDTDADLNVE